MTRVSDIYGGYLKAADLKGAERTVTIKQVTVVEMEDFKTKELVKKIVLRFQETSRPLVLNKTNAHTISQLHGEEFDQLWAGKQIKLFPDKCSFNGATQCIRVRPPQPTPTTPIPGTFAEPGVERW